nr:unnamed protein product [Digitaria exilis]
MVARTLAEWEALAARAEAALAAAPADAAALLPIRRRGVVGDGGVLDLPRDASAMAALQRVKLDDGSLGAPVVLPHFPYAQQAVAEPAACAICLDELRHGELCSEVPACRHIFHESCIRAWTKKMNSCPLCRAKIVPGGAPAAADGMV